MGGTSCHAQPRAGCHRSPRTEPWHREDTAIRRAVLERSRPLEKPRQTDTPPTLGKTFNSQFELKSDLA